MKNSLLSALVCCLLVTAHGASAQIALSFTSVSPSCHGYTNGSATVTAFGGNAPYSYHWGNGQSTQSNIGIGAGVYAITVTDANNQTVTGSTTVTEPNLLTVDVVVTNIPCASDPLGGAVNAVILGGTNPYSVLWNDGNTDPSRQNLPAGTYSVTAADAHGCTAVDQGTIQIPTPLVVSIVSITPSCGGANNGSATILASGGTPPYTHTWTPGGFTGTTATGLAPGQYYVCTFDANHCQKDLWVIIPEIQQLDVTLSVVSAECTGVNDGVVTAIVNPPGNYEYHWNLPPFTGVSQLTGIAAGTVVSVTVTDPAGGCSGTATTTVGVHNVINVNVTDTDVTCAGQNNGTATALASGGIPAYTYQWLVPPTGPPIGTGPTITGLSAGAYMVSVTDSRGCTAIGSANIGIESAPVAVIGGSNTVTCGATESVVQFENLSTDAYGTITSWVWTVTTSLGVQTFSNISPIQLTLPVGLTGTIQLEVTTANGCVAVTTHNFTVPGLPNISLNVGPVAVDCQNAPIHLIVNGGNSNYTYVWSPLNGLTLDSIPPNAVANPAVTTTYQLIASDQGCRDTVSVQVIRVTPITLTVDHTVIETCDSTVLLLATSNVPNVVWIDANGTVLGNPPGTNPVVVIPGITTIYTAIATDTNGCIDSLPVSVTALPPVSISIDSVAVDCNNAPVHLNVHGGDPTFTYVWSPLAGLTLDSIPPNAIANPTTSTTYQLIASHGLGCADTTFVNVIRVTPINLSVDHTVIETCDSTVLLSANANVPNVVWIDANGTVLGNPPGNNPVVVIPGDTTIYTAIATDIYGCIDSLPVTVSALPPVSISIDSVAIDCHNAPVHLVVHGGNPAYSYVWSPLAGLTLDPIPPNATANPATTTTYQLIASRGLNCVDTAFVHVIRVTPINLSVDHTVIETCDSTVLLSANANVPNVVWIDANGTVLGNPPGNNPVVVIPGDTTIYTAIATDIYGCIDSLPVTVSALPPVSISIDSVAIDCHNAPVHLVVHGGNPAYSYVWSPLAGLTLDPIPPNATANPATTTTYQLIASRGLNCVDTAFVNVIRVTPINLSVDHTVIETCDSTITLSANSNIPNVVWIDENGTVLGNPPGSNPVVVIPGDTTIYTAIATDIYGCVDSLPVTVSALPPINISIDSVGVDCNNGPAYLVVHGGNPAYTYEWSPLASLTLDATPPNATANPAVTTTYQLIASRGYHCADTALVNVIRVVPIQLSVAQDVIQTCDSTVLLSATANVPNVWWINAAGDTLGNHPANPVTVDAGTTVIYTAIASDVYGCADSTTVSVTGIGIDVDVDPNMPNGGCADTDIQLGLINHHPDDVLHYLWTAAPPLVLVGGTSSSPTVSGPAGTYNVTVTVTNQNTCSRTLIIPVHIDTMQTLQQAVSADLCHGKIVKFFNNSGYTGLWNFGDSQTSTLDNPTHAYAAAGMYQVSFTPNNNLCVMPWDSMINVQNAPLNAPGILSNYANCIENAQIQFNGSANNPNVVWTWTFTHGVPATSHEQNPLITFTQEDTIIAHLTIQDPNGCTIDSSISVPIIFINDHIPEVLTFCKDTTIELNPDGVDPTANYLWTAVPPDSQLIPTEKNPTVSPDVETVYSVTISQGPLCSVTYSVTVTPKDGAQVHLPNDTIVCNSNPLTITATGNGINYVWSKSPTFIPVLAVGPTVTISPTEDGVYYVHTTNIAGCAALDSIKINNGATAIQPEPYDGDICAGEETQLFVTNLAPGDTLSYHWSPTLPNVPNPTVSPSQETTYHLYVSNQFNCKDTLDYLVHVTTVNVNAEVTGKDTLCPGQSTTLLATPSTNSAIKSILWSPASTLSDANIADPVASPDAEQVYTVTVTTQNGCTATDDVTIYFMSGQCVEPYIFVPKAFTPNNDLNNDLFIVRGVNITELKFIVWDRWGEKVYETNDPAAQGWDGTFNGKELTPDSYAWYLRARCANGAIYERKGDVTLLK